MKKKNTITKTEKMNEIRPPRLELYEVLVTIEKHKFGFALYRYRVRPHFVRRRKQRYCFLITSPKFQINFYPKRCKITNKQCC